MPRDRRAPDATPAVVARVDEPRDVRTSRRRCDEAGALVLIGGACSPLGPALGRFLELSEARAGAAIVGLTTASGDPRASAEGWRNDFLSAGATRVEIPIVDSRSRANDPAIARLVRGARGIFLGGGDQVHLVATLSGTRVGEALWEAHCEGAIVCGTSAGAAAVTETTMAYGEMDDDGNLVEMYIGPGLGLLGYRAMIDTHFGARKRLQRLFVAIGSNPELLGLGIDEDTALVVHDHIGEVVGSGGVTFVDGRGARFSSVGEDGPPTISALRVGIIGPGHQFNLRERELEALVRQDAALGSAAAD